MLFQPGWTVATWHFQLDVELLQCLFQLLLIPSIVCSYGIVEQDELVVQYFHLRGSRKTYEDMSITELKSNMLVWERGAELASSPPYSLPGTSA